MTLSKDDLIQELIRDGYLKTSRIINAFQKIDRKDFLPEEIESNAYMNTALPIGFGQTISQPLVVAFMLELLEPKAREKILDIGSGSGWKAALLSYCAGPKGLIISIERIPELKEMAEKNIGKYNFIKKGIVKVILGDGTKPPADLMPQGGYNKIIAGAAGKEIPKIWKEQLKTGGRIVAPVGNSILTMDKISAFKFKTKEYKGFSFVPLISDF